MSVSFLLFMPVKNFPNNCLLIPIILCVITERHCSDHVRHFQECPPRPQHLDLQSADGSLAFLVLNNHSSLVYSRYSALGLFNQWNCSLLGHVWFVLIYCTWIYSIYFNYFNWFTASKLFADLWQYSFLKLNLLTRTESSGFTSDFEHLASSHISQRHPCAADTYWLT